MLEPLGVAIHAVDLAHIKPGMTVGVFGCGPIGLLIAQVARLVGATKVIATDILPHRVEAALSLGADLAWLVEERLTEAVALKATGESGVDVAFEAAGVQGAVDDAFMAVAIGGKVILAGIPDNDQTSFTASIARRKGLTIKLVRRMKSTYPRAIEMVARRQVDVKSLVTHRFPLSQTREAFETASRRDGLKVVIRI
jgi:L-iditol 2-dehydrogenase